MARKRRCWSPPWILLGASLCSVVLWLLLHRELLGASDSIFEVKEPAPPPLELRATSLSATSAPRGSPSLAPKSRPTTPPKSRPTTPSPATAVREVSAPHVSGASGTATDSAAPNSAKSAKSLTVALAAELKQLEGVLVVINSAMSNAADPSSLKFRIISSGEDAEPLVAKVKSRLPAWPMLDIGAVDFDPWNPRVGKLLGGKSSSRKELFDALNFAAFYLHEALPDLANGRVLYLDTDVVVVSDLAPLASLDLQGHAAGAAEDCSQRVGKYIDVDRLKALQSELPAHQVSKKSCVVNRGVVLVDCAAWKKHQVTESIEQLVKLHLTKGKGPLWRAGVSQPPFLIALAGKYLDLGAEYNVRGLGRGDIAPEEVDFYKKRKRWDPYYDKFLRKCKFHCCPGCKGWALSPYVSALAQQAKILHFNGRLKPSHAAKRGTEPVLPPTSEEDRSVREQRPLCSCGHQCLQECAGIWWKYLPPE
ncbi:unnamed protein product [Effrenium voratum]|uniref:Hexosyltransferase n=1 Tax=Effrenium voratum TaxID=2562239 RepID=A0AA36JS11_9DINO|nr:unnamed protein product [Effrenium voratum]CAJ1435633.1 unnamed protein product [Effrenium voratum]